MQNRVENVLYAEYILIHERLCHVEFYILREILPISNKYFFFVQSCSKKPNICMFTCSFIKQSACLIIFISCIHSSIQVLFCLFVSDKDNDRFSFDWQKIQKSILWWRIYIYKNTIVQYGNIIMQNI